MAQFTQTKNGGVIMAMEAIKGCCWQCSQWNDYLQYCSYYKTHIYGQGFYKNCNYDGK